MTRPRNTPEFNQLLLQDFESATASIVDDRLKRAFGTIYVSLKFERFEQSRNISDLDDAAAKCRWILDGTSDDDESLESRLTNFLKILSCRYQVTEELGNLVETKSVLQRLINTMPSTDTQFPMMLDLARINFYRLYEHTSDPNWLKDAIKSARDATSVSDPHDPQLRQRLCELAGLLGAQNEYSGEVRDLEEAVTIGRMLATTMHVEDTGFGGMLGNLAITLHMRYRRTQKSADLDEAISLLKYAISVTSEKAQLLGSLLQSLGNALYSRHERTGGIADLEESLEVFRLSIKIGSLVGELDSGRRLTCLGGALYCYYGRTGNMADLEEAIHVTQRATELTLSNRTSYASAMSNLSMLLAKRHSHTGAWSDFEKAVKVAQAALEIMPENHADLEVLLSNLALRLVHPRISNKRDALEYFIRAWKCTNANPFRRIFNARHAGALLQAEGRYEEAYDILTEALGMLERVHKRVLSQDDQQTVISSFSGLAAAACALALELKHTPEIALEAVERGRAAIIGLVMDDRSDTNALKEVEPQLCAKYHDLRMEINTPLDNLIDERSRQLQARRQPLAIKELEDCIQQIRRVPGFEAFRESLKPEQMKQCAAEGFIVVVNVTDLRSDAICISSQRVGTIQLRNFKAESVRAWIDKGLTLPASPSQPSKNPQYRAFLSWLWHACVKPILDDLGCQPVSSFEQLSRVWWIGTGWASALPFHAAGDLQLGDESSFARVLSSYSPSVKALHHTTSGRSRRPGTCSATLKALVVSMETTPGANDLPGAEKEKSEVVAALQTCTTVQELTLPSVADVIENLLNCQIAHFATHGVSDPMNPSESGLLLTPSCIGGATAKADILSVRKMIESHLPEAEIAYLSACSTANNKVRKLEDEALHLVSGFQVAGFRHVIGCLWPSLDSVCVDVAKAFYSHLILNGELLLDDKAVAIALHKAVLAIRESEEFRKRPLAWAQYVHFGA